ncbi:hypothetical protein T492DRAFT_863815 [Pavlovales sp. CCMP2436]|nr:hypothetical protein T492DRAFT_863815 [Pavlovales sp. CCMP2436]
MSLGERAALESLLPSLLGGSADDGAALPPGVLPALWEMLAAAAPARLAASFHGNGVAARQAWADGAAALELLTMADVPDVLRGRSDAIISAALSSPFCARLAAAGCAALKAAAPTGTVPQARALVALRSVLAWEPVQGSADERGWYALCQRALDCAFALAPRPELELALALRGLHARALGGRAKDTTSHANDEETEEVEGEKESTVPPAALCRLLVAIAHGAICALVRAERLDKDLKAVRARSGAGEAQDASTVSAPTAKGKKAGKQQEDAASTAAAESALESELGAKAEADEADGEALRLLAERDVALCSGSAMRGGSENVRVAAALALSQLMEAPGVSV